jgi:NMD protein affecting ribosome stability and mRNA decay
LWQKPQGFAASHCRNCGYGWTRTGAEGELTVCLLDREPVLAEMTGCDHFEPKEAAAG